uniref:HECT-type E3 ubiquitin transferase n=1 Tax=Hirondellea gigas TaxID=1518452 RepID=A0A6A7G6W7_9CRUS
MDGSDRQEMDTNSSNSPDPEDDEERSENQMDCASDSQKKKEFSPPEKSPSMMQIEGEQPDDMPALGFSDDEADASNKNNASSKNNASRDPAQSSSADSERLKQKLSARIQRYFQQLTKGCGRYACSNSHCASHEGFVKLMQKEALSEAIRLVRSAEGTVPTCEPISPLSLKLFQEMFARAKETGSYREIIHLVGASFGDPDVLDISFSRCSEGKEALSTEDDSGMDIDSILETFQLINDCEETANASEHALTRVFNTIDLHSMQDHAQHVRKYLILLVNPAFLDPSHLDLVKRVCISIVKLREFGTRILTNWISTFSHSHLEDVQAMIQQYISIRWIHTRELSDVAPAVHVLNVIKEANDISNHLPFRSFYNDAINEDFPTRADYYRWLKKDLGHFSFCKYHFLLDPAAKSKVLQVHSFVQMGEEYRQAVIQSMLGTRTSPYLNLLIRRDFVVQDALIQLQAKEEFKKPLRVKFRGEDGIDEGGVQKEFFQIIIRQLFQPEYGMFEHDPDTRLYWFSKDAFENGSEFELVGLLLGLAVYNGVILDIHFPDIVYKKLVGMKKATLDDLDSFKPELSKGLRQLLAFDGDVESTFLRNFSFEYQIFGQTKVVELKEDGANIPLTKDNRQEYVDLYVDYILNKSVAQQFDPFHRGFHLVCGGVVFEWFRWEELELLVCGSKELDFDALEESARYEDGYYHDSPIIINFWTILHAMSDEKKKRFLFFCTGSDRVPIRGLVDLVLTISKNGDDSLRLPTAHTCFNHLLLPEYSSKEILSERLLTAIENAEGFGLL